MTAASAVTPSANERDKDNNFGKLFLDKKNIRPAESCEENVSESEREASETLLLLSSHSQFSPPTTQARYQHTSSSLYITYTLIKHYQYQYF